MASVMRGVTMRTEILKMPLRRTAPLSVSTWITCVLVYLVYHGGSAVQGSPVPVVGVGPNLLLDTPIVAIGRCRVECMKKISIPTIQRSKTKPNHHFQECWNICEDRYRNPKVFEPVCRGKYCSKGCQAACAFWNGSHSVDKAAQTANVSWTWPEEVETDTDYMHITMLWLRPEPNPPVPRPHPIVYTLLMRENNDAWQLIGQTYEESYIMEHDQAAFVPEFLIQAIDETGIIAHSIFHVQKMIFSNVIQSVANGALVEGRGKKEQHLPDRNSVNLTYSLTYERSDGLEARLNWTHPPGMAQQGGEEVFYEVVYILLECGIYEDLPKCPYTDDLYTSLVPVRRRDVPQFTIDQLFFNTRYIVRVQLPNEPLPSGELARVLMETPRCQSPSEDFRHCDFQPDVTTPLGQNASAGAGLDVTEPPSLTELIRDVVIELLPQQQDDGQVLVNVSWTYISDPSKVNFSITLITFDDESFATDTVEISGVTHFTAKLLDNTLYEVVIDLIAPPEAVGLNDTRYGQKGRRRNYLDDSRQWRQFNTSELQLATRERHQAVRMNKKDLKAVNGVIIGVTCVAVLVVVAFIVLFLYKKRQSFKGIIIPKTTVAKSNSYKSSVGGKADYSNQLMVFCDEWELDPQQLTFSTPLGQGAFGKVVTGYYSDHKVAIKLVKEGAPLSYKEDLVAEINLMKRLGTHPNIVCLVGACTVTDPIALVMEYVPYGNLQNFLKKCRLEGDLQKRSNGPSEIQYSMLQDCGGIENGVITPTDMLSFARQVAMAMEYLAEKKYVHRDLAARNILLHYNKVVKVCDFGLSRDIFNDNQYKKLTNGKLPLKWMAIESLRDRVFTTQSDVWSFGILLWEIVTMGASPYPCIALADLYYVLSNHYRMDRPSNCSNELYALMRTCWAESPLDRPSFTELREQLEDLMAEDRDYLVLEDIDVPLSASESSSNPTAPDLFSGELLPSQAAREAVSASSSESSASASASASGLLRQGPAAVRRPPMTIDVCIHQKSTERLMRPSESDSSP